MVPLPCNPETISIGYGLRNGASVLPVTSLIPREEFVAIAPNAITFEKHPVLREKFVELFSLSSGATEDISARKSSRPEWSRSRFTG